MEKVQLRSPASHLMHVKRPAGDYDNIFHTHTHEQSIISPDLLHSHLASICLGVALLPAKVRPLWLLVKAPLACTPCRLCWRWHYLQGPIHISPLSALSLVGVQGPLWARREALMERQSIGKRLVLASDRWHSTGMVEKIIISGTER